MATATTWAVFSEATLRALDASGHTPGHIGMVERRDEWFTYVPLDREL